MKFKEFKNYVSRIDRVSICIKETLEYENYMFISEVPDKFDELYLFGVGMRNLEFPLSQVVEQWIDYPDVTPEQREKKTVFADCIEIMLSETERDLERESNEEIIFKL